jgi:hypothetical protein
VFNPQPTVSQLAIGDGARCVVLDNALEDPQALVDLAVKHRRAFAPAAGNAFPGIELPMPGSVADRFGECFAQHARSVLDARRVLSGSGRLSMVTLQPAQLAPIQRVCHRDRLAAAADQCVGAGVLYLFGDEALGGTNFCSPRDPLDLINERMQRWSDLDNMQFTQETGWPASYMTRSNQHFELTAVVPPRFNRLIFYDGARFHGSHIGHPERLSDDPARGRLTLNLFFVCRRRAR